MKKEIELKPKKPILAYMGMDKRTLIESVPTQVVEVVYPHRIDAPKKDTGTKLFEEGQLGTGEIIKLPNLPKNRLNEKGVRNLLLKYFVNWELGSLLRSKLRAGTVATINFIKKKFFDCSLRSHLSRRRLLLKE